MRVVKKAIQALVSRIPRPVLLPLILVAIGSAGYLVVQTARFEYCYYRAGEALEREAFEEAGKYLAECMRLDPQSGRARFRAAQTARRSDQPEFAQEQLTYCADLAWPAEAVELERAMLAFQRGDGTPASEQLLKHCLAPQNVERHLALEVLAKGNIRGYQLFKALEYLDAWVKMRPDSLGARMRRAWVYERLDRLADAESDYRAVLMNRPDDTSAKLQLALNLRQQGKVPEAAELLEELKKNTPNSHAIDLGLAQAYRTLGRGEEARRLLEDLEARNTNDHAVMLEKGRLCLDEGRVLDARAALERAVALAPEEYEPNYQLFLCLQRLGDKKAAASAEKKFKSIEADLKQMGQLTEALQNKPDDPEIRLQIAEIFLRRGELSEGTAWLEGVVRLAPDHVKARQALAKYYEQLGKPDRARLHRQALPAASR